MTDKGYIDIEIPIGYADSTAYAAYIPLDAIYQTADAAYLFIAEKDKAKSRKITLGEVYGTYVAVTKGINDGDKIIVSRNVVDGDKIQTK